VRGGRRCGGERVRTSECAEPVVATTKESDRSGEGEEKGQRGCGGHLTERTAPISRPRLDYEIYSSMEIWEGAAECLSDGDNESSIAQS
jgi:hypothetical protein